MTPPEPWVERILRVVDHVSQHLDDELQPPQLAQIAGFSLHHFHRVFRGMTGESVMAFVRRLRLERAALRLKYSEQSVTQVAMASGYQSHEAFTRAFRSRFQASPSEFRGRERGDLPQGIRFFESERPEVISLAVRHTGPYEQSMQSWERLLGWAGSSGVLEHSPESLGLCYDDPEVTETAQLRYDACLVVPEGLPSQYRLPSDISVRKIAGGHYGGALHVGCYSSILDTYVALLGHWLPEREVELVDEPVLEVYLNSPYETSVDDLRTEICVRIAGVGLPVADFV